MCTCVCVQSRAISFVRLHRLVPSSERSGFAGGLVPKERLTQEKVRGRHGDAGEELAWMMGCSEAMY